MLTSLARYRLWRWGEKGLDRSEPFFERVNLLSLLPILFGLLVHLVQWHRCEFLVLHSLNLAIFVLDHKVRINLGHFLGNQSVI